MKRKQKMSRKRKASATIAGALALVLLLGGAYAWTNFSQNAINRFNGNASPGVLLHDDFEQGVNKDVYVENIGTVDLIVRVKFNEYLQIGNTPIVGTSPNDRDTWVTRTFPTTMPADGVLPAENYHIWEMTGEEKLYKPGTGSMGNQIYTSGQTFEDGTEVKMTEGRSSVVTMSEWNDLPAVERAERGCWILDTDGWCYWSQLLKPDTATNLLLDNAYVDSNTMPDDNYSYNIDVNLQASNKSDVEEMITEGGGTANGKSFLESMGNLQERYNQINKDIEEVYGGELPADKKLDTIDGHPAVVDKDSGELILDEVNFPDTKLLNLLMNGYTTTVYDAIEAEWSEPYFEESILGITSTNGRLSETDRLAVTNLVINSNESKFGIDLGLTSLDGIEFFPNLENLQAMKNKIEKVDMSSNLKLKNLHLAGNEITTLDVRKNLELEELICSDNHMTNVDLSNNPKLKVFQAFHSKFTNLDFSNNPNLYRINVSGSKELKNIQIKNNLNLVLLTAYQCPKLETVDVSNCSNLEELNVQRNSSLSEVNISGCDKLKLLEIYMEDNDEEGKLSEIAGLDTCTSLEIIRAYGQPLITSINVENLMNLRVLRVENTNISQLNVINNSQLTNLYVTNCSISELDISNTNITVANNLRIQNNGLQKLYVNTTQANLSFTSGTYHTPGNASPIQIINVDE